MSALLNFLGGLTNAGDGDSILVNAGWSYLAPLWSGGETVESKEGIVRKRAGNVNGDAADQAESFLRTTELNNIFNVQFFLRTW